MSEERFHHAIPDRRCIVHIVDPDPPTYEQLRALFRVEGLQTAVSVSLSGFLAAFARRRPDVVIANLDLSGDDGLDVLRRVRRLGVGTPVFMLENQPLVAAAVAAMKAGASDVITRPIDGDHLVRMVRDALRHDMNKGAARVRRPIEIRSFAQLTPREREVLRLVTSGQSNKEAGRELGISPRTIEVHRARVMEKLGAKNTADLMRIVLTS